MYGNYVEGVSKTGDKYGFIDEYKVRMESGITLILAIYSFISIVFFGIFLIPTIIIGLIFIDFIFKSFVQPKSLFFGKISEILIKKLGFSKPYYIGAVQKRFAFRLGFGLSLFAFLCVLIVSGYLASYGICVGPYEMSQQMTKLPYTAVPFTPPLVACLLCIIFMFSESVFGYCVGCKIYKYFVKIGFIKKVPGQNCVNGRCELPK